MIKKAAVFITSLFFLNFAYLGQVAAVDLLCSQYQDGACIAGPCSAASASSSPACQQDATQNKSKSNPIAGPNGVLQKAANLIAELTGVVGVIMIIAGGITFATAGGAPGGQRAGDNPNRAKKARTMIFAALTGMVVVALAWTIVTFVVQKFVK